MAKNGKESSKGMKKDPECLYHYLSLKYLLSILKNRCLCFCNPDYWEDKNDACYAKMATPKNKMVGIICFTNKKETCTHWMTYASKGVGVKLTFKFDELIESLKKNNGVNDKFLSHYVCYKSRKNVLEVDFSEIDKRYWPLFVKKKAYQNEREYRAVCLVDAERMDFGKKIRQIKIPLSCISRITISPYVQKSVAYDVIKLLKEYIDLLANESKESLNIEVKHSTMMYDKKWQNAGRKLVNSTMNAEYANEEEKE